MRDVIARAPCIADSTDITQFAPNGAAVQPYDLTNDRHLNIVPTAPVGGIRRAQLRFDGSRIHFHVIVTTFPVLDSLSLTS